MKGRGDENLKLLVKKKKARDLSRSGTDKNVVDVTRRGHINTSPKVEIYLGV